MVPVNTSYCYEGGAIKFYPNGDCEIWTSKAYETWKWSGWYPDDEEWEIMKDKTLKIDDEYYDWNTDWRISGDSLTIGNKHYSLNDNCNYREELDIN